MVVLLFSTVKCCEVWWCRVVYVVQLSVVKYGGGVLLCSTVKCCEVW